MAGRYFTPLRYPGGKQRLTPFLSEIIQTNGLLGCDYVEPYAGGAGVAIQLLLEKKVSKIHLNDSSEQIYSFWRSVVYNSERFCQMISSAALTVDEWKRQREIVRNPGIHDELELGFGTFYLNRCNRSGVLAGGLIGGLEQTGPWKMDARFSRNELIRRVELISAQANNIHIECLDAEKFLVDYAGLLPEDTLIYCDPPYFNKAKRLYLNAYEHGDHARISDVIQKRIKHHWLVSYDSAPEILDYYVARRSIIYDLQYNASKVYKGKEVFIFSDSMVIPSRSKLTFVDQAITAESKLPLWNSTC